ncbi:MAG: carotenoid 1,2-hydratase [Armatimonadota bacterium]
MKPLCVGLVLLLVACVPVLQEVDPARPPEAGNWGPNPAAVEWWYVSGYLPDDGIAFHWAVFKGYFTPRLGPAFLGFLYPGPFHASHLAVTDLRAGRKLFDERFDFRQDAPRGDAVIEFPPLRIEQGDWRLVQEGASYRLMAGPLDVRLTPKKPAVVHPPGYSGTGEVGRMYYVSYTRLGLEGRINGRAVQGEAWMDHQWGGQLSGREALWDWFGLHLSDGSDLMLYRVKKPPAAGQTDGEVVQLAGSRTDPEGRIVELRNLRMTPLERWTSPSGRSYALSWRVEAEGLELELAPVRRDQELLTASTGVAYWEGPVRGQGTWQGSPVEARGMGEFVAGTYSPVAMNLGMLLPGR